MAVCSGSIECQNIIVVNLFEGRNGGGGVGPPLKKKLFPVHRPSRLQRADWDFFFMIFEKRFFFSIFLVHSSQ